MTPRVAVIGAGASGIALGARLGHAGIETYTIFEQAEALGGTWRDNAYPGSGCDVPSHLYSFSFARRADWTRKYAKQPEILSYLQSVADEHGVTDHIRFSTPVRAAEWDDERAVWTLRLDDGESVEADVLVGATGQLNTPVVPDLPGLSDFAGTAFHSARWRHDHDLAGRDVAVIGSGASVIQIVPSIADRARSVTIFQRSPAYIIPKPDRGFTAMEKRAFAAVPGLEAAYRAWLYLRFDARFAGFRGGESMSARAGQRLSRRMTRITRQVEIEGVATEAVRPDYPTGCKRILISNDYYDTLARPDVNVRQVGIDRVLPFGVRTVDGAEHPADTLIFGTGFDALRFLGSIEVTGRRGLDLHQVWRDGAEAYFGLAVPGFPNFFMLYGPNTNLGHSSILFMVERQVDYLVALLVQMAHAGSTAMEVTPAAMARYNARMQRAMATTVWAAGCTSWYKTAAGKITNNWPGFTTQFWWATRRPRWTDWNSRPRVGSEENEKVKEPAG